MQMRQALLFALNFNLHHLMRRQLFLRMSLVPV